MKFFIRFIYKLLGVYTRMHIMNVQHEHLKTNVKLKHIPKINDLIYFEDGGDYFIVIKVIHYIEYRHEIWVVVEQFADENKNKIK